MPTPMTELKDLTNPHGTSPRFSVFIMAANLDIKNINKKIIEFNHAKADEEKLILLNQIYTLREEMINRYPLNYIADCKDYQDQIHRDLWISLKEQFAALGVSSLQNRLLPKTSSTAEPWSATEIFSNMSLPELEKFMSICWNNPLRMNIMIRNIYSHNSPEKHKFLKFLATHQLTMLYPDGNSRNIKIEKFPADGSLPVILKIDARLNKPKEAEQCLRRKDFSHFTKRLSEERQATIIGEGSPIVATLFLNDFCRGGNLQSMSSRMHKRNLEHSKVVLSALDYYQQMASILIELQQKGCIFPDAKNTNWLIDADNKLKISDTKSLLFIATDGSLKYGDENNKWSGGMVSSKGTCPKEIKSFGENASAVSADKVHSFILGKNLYQYLTNCSFEVLHKVFNDNFSNAYEPGFSENDSSLDWLDDFKLESQIFRTVGGKVLHELIKNLAQPDPQNRCSLSEALEELKKINHWFVLQQDCNNLCKKLQSDWKEDEILMRHISTVQNKLLNGQDEISELEKLKKDLSYQCKLMNQVNKLSHLSKLAFGQTPLDKRDFYIQKMDKSGSNIRESLSANPTKISYLVKLEEEGILQLIIRELWKQHKKGEKSHYCFSSEAEHTYREIQKQDKNSKFTVDEKVQAKLSLIHKYVAKEGHKKDAFAKSLLDFFSMDFLILNNNRNIKESLADMKQSSESTAEEIIVNRGKP